MKQAIIDIGSNSMRLTLYDISDSGFKILFREKDMAGLAGYVENNVLSSDGIKRACEGLNHFKHTLNALEIKNVNVFATASLRNIANTNEAVKTIKENTGISVEVISGIEEAMYGYYGALQKINVKNGVYVDIGGASTEVVTFKENKILSSNSFPVGSLFLYKRCVKDILPNKASMKKIKSTIDKNVVLTKLKGKKTFIAVGGSARGVLKLAKKYYGLDRSVNVITREQMDGLTALLLKDSEDREDLILRIEPERIHTLIPGFMVLKNIFDFYGTDEIYVSDYGVREGYLCQKQSLNNTHIVKTEN